MTGPPDDGRGWSRSVDADLAATAGALAEGGAPDDAGYLALRLYLVRLASRRSPPGQAEAEDVVDEALTRFLTAATAGRIDSTRALPYLITIVQNELIDRRRKRRNTVTEPFEDRPMTDDAIARLVDSTATATILEAALALAARRGDHTCTRVINEWLREAEQQGSNPSSREVARRAGVSHVTVQHALHRLADYVREAAVVS